MPPRPLDELIVLLHGQLQLSKRGPLLIALPDSRHYRETWQSNEMFTN